MSSETIALITVPFFTGIIGYVTNWSGVLMLFQPVHYWGFRVPGLKLLAPLLPRRVAQVPIGLDRGRFGWQGIVPARAAKMGSISTDKAIAKLGSPAEFYQQFEPEKMAEFIVENGEEDMHDLVERIMEREHPQLWADLPPQVREAVHARVQNQLPGIVRGVVDAIGEKIDHLIDIKLMVIRQFESDPAIANRAFLEVGRRELRLMVNFGFIFGFLLGIPVAAITHFVHEWWLLPILGVIVGYVTNLAGMSLIFEPIEPRKILGITVHGLFLRRQHDVAAVYADIIAEDVVTIQNLGNELLHGPQSDRTRRLIMDSLRPAVDGALGPARAAVRVAVGTGQYDRIRESMAEGGVEYTMVPFRDEAFSKQQSTKMRELLTERVRELPHKDFCDMLRSAMREDEWMLYLHGAVLGFGGGLVHLAVFGTGG